MSRRVIKSVLISILLFNALTGQVISQTWNYPVKLGTSEWAELKTNEEKYEACRIPNDILKSLSTFDLIEICIEYPLFHRVILYKDLITGFNNLKVFMA